LTSISYLNQIQADILGMDVQLGSSREASAIGAAILAGIQLGVWTTEEIRRMTTHDEVVHREPNEGLERRYRQWKELHRITRAMDTLQI
jgi:glycerol kinase